MLAKKVDTLNKAMEVEAKKMRREVAAMEKEVSAMRNGSEHDQRARRLSAPRASVTMTRSLSARYGSLEVNSNFLLRVFFYFHSHNPKPNDNVTNAFCLLLFFFPRLFFSFQECKKAISGYAIYSKNITKCQKFYLRLCGQ